jgi:hypothetical protein
VVATVMLGDMVEYILRLPNGEELFSRLPRGAEALPGQGQEVWAYWAQAHATIFPYEALSGRESGLSRRGSSRDG